MKREITLPIDEKAARALRAGDVLYLTGALFTARDEAHRRMLAASDRNESIPFDASAMALYHCGPIVRRTGSGWKAVAAGPTTSARMEPFEGRFLETFRTRIIVGKGGMGDHTQETLEKMGAIYAHSTGGAGALAAARIERVVAVHWLAELGMPEAVWVFSVRDFGPLWVTMDSRGGNLYKELEPRIAENLRAIRARIDS